MKYTLEEIQKVMKEEGIGNASTRYVLERLQRIDNRGEEVHVGAEIKAEVKKMPTYDGVPVYPSANNNVTFDHKDERCHLHFLTNGNIAVSKDSNRKTYLEINKDQLLNLIFTKF